MSNVKNYILLETLKAPKGITMEVLRNDTRVEYYSPVTISFYQWLKAEPGLIKDRGGWNYNRTHYMWTFAEAKRGFDRRTRNTKQFFIDTFDYKRSGYATNPNVVTIDKNDYFEIKYGDKEEPRTWSLQIVEYGSNEYKKLAVMAKLIGSP